MKPTPLKDIPEDLRLFNQERFKSELAQGVFDLMRRQGVNRTRLAELLGTTKPGISRMLSGSQNLRAETIADIYLVLGRTPHLTLGTDLESVRFPVDEDDIVCEALPPSFSFIKATAKVSSGMTVLDHGSFRKLSSFQFMFPERSPDPTNTKPAMTA